MSERKPTSQNALYDWHRRALAGESPPVWEDTPQPGWYVRSYGDRGLLYPAMIWMEQEVDETGELLTDEYLRCEVACESRNPLEEWTYLAKHPITKEEYHELVRHVLFAENYIGPLRPFVRWLDEREIAADFLRYEGVNNHAV